MRFRNLLPILGASLLLGACSKQASPILIQRGVPYYEREYLVTEEGFGIDNRLKKIYLQGYIEEGMTQEMVLTLWGPGDRTFDDDKVWEYVDRQGNLISRVKFEQSQVARLGVKELVVSSIEGDRYGGSPAPQGDAINPNSRPE